MKKNQLGLSDLYISEIGFGCMSLGTDEHKATKLLHEAFDLGINFFDTADLYDYGRNEEIVGNALKEKRSEIIIATKVGNRWRQGNDGWDWDPSKAYILEAVKESLRRLQTDYIDLYQLHGGTIDDNIEETVDAFEQLKREGLIRHYGISSIRPNVVREYVNKSNIVSVMVQYNLLDRRPEDEILPLLLQKNISAIARGPLAKGLLTGSTVKANKSFLDYSEDELLEILSKMKNVEKEKQAMGDTALRYALAHPAVATVIPGASKLEQLKENVNASKLDPLTDGEIKYLQSITRANTYESHR